MNQLLLRQYCAGGRSMGAGFDCWLCVCVCVCVCVWVMNQLLLRQYCAGGRSMGAGFDCWLCMGVLLNPAVMRMLCVRWPVRFALWPPPIPPPSSVGLLRAFFEPIIRIYR
jgi:hypothetical protein